MSGERSQNGQIQSSRILMLIGSSIAISAAISWTLILYMSDNIKNDIEIRIRDSKSEISVLRQEFSGYRSNVNKELRDLRNQVLALSRRE